MRLKRTRNLATTVAVTTTLGLAGLPLLLAPASAAPAPRLELSITADKTTAAGGDSVVYTLSVKNTGGSVATAPVITHTVPDGLTLTSAPGCSTTGATLTCTLGDLAAGATAAPRTVTATVDAFTAPAPSDSGHRLVYVKEEKFVELPAGKATTASLACPAGHVVTDGSLQLDSVHASSATDVFTTESRADDVDGRSGWVASVVNDGARATGKLRVSCLATQTTGSSHTHALVGGVTHTTGTATGADGDGVIAATSGSCASGQVAIAPSFRFVAGSGLMTSSAPQGAGWSFTAEELEDDSELVASVACLDLATAPAHGHSAQLGLRSVDPVARMIEDGASGSVETSCGPSAYAVAGGFSATEPGLLQVGFDPRYETRAHQFFNDSGDKARAEVSAVCLESSLGGERGSKQITSTAVVTSGTRSASGSTTITAIAGGEPATPSISAAGAQHNAAGSKIKVTVSCGAAPCTLTGKAISLGSESGGIAKGKQIGYGKTKLAAGQTKVLKLGVKSSFRTQVKSSGFKKFTLTLRGGGVDEKIDLAI